MANLIEFSLAEQITELKRELTMREQVYPRLVAARKMRADIAESRIACLEAAIASLERIST